MTLLTYNDYNNYQFYKKTKASAIEEKLPNLFLTMKKQFCLGPHAIETKLGRVAICLTFSCTPPELKPDPIPRSYT